MTDERKRTPPFSKSEIESVAPGLITKLKLIIDGEVIHDYTEEE